MPLSRPATPNVLQTATTLLLVSGVAWLLFRPEAKDYFLRSRAYPTAATSARRRR
ncbi:hypothetical protein [Flindersiella endophytica]